MSEHQGRFAIVPVWVITDMEISHAAFRVLALLSSYANKDGWAWPEQTTMGELLGVDRSAISKSLSALAARGYIEIEAEKLDSAGARTRNRYRLLYDRGTRRVQPEHAERAEEARAGQLGGTRPHAQTLDTGTDQKEQTNGTKSPPPAASARVNRYQVFIDGVRSRGKEYATSSTDAKAVNDSGADPDKIAEAWVALQDGQWGDDFTRGLPLRDVVPRMGQWFNRRGKQYENLGTKMRTGRSASTEEERQQAAKEIQF